MNTCNKILLFLLFSFFLFALYSIFIKRYLVIFKEGLKGIGLNEKKDVLDQPKDTENIKSANKEIQTIPAEKQSFSSCDEKIDKDTKDQIIKNAGNISAISQNISILLDKLKTFEPDIEDNTTMSKKNEEKIKIIGESIHNEQKKKEEELDKLPNIR